MENQPNELCSHLSENKAGFFGPISSKVTVTKGKKRRKRKSEEEERRRREKSNGCTLGFHNGYLKDSFWPEKIELSGPFGGKALKNPVQIDQRSIKLRIRASGIVKPFCLIHSSRMPFYS